MNGCCFNPIRAELIGVTTSDPPVEPALFMRFDSTLSMPVADPANVNDWNTSFGQTFTSVVQDGNDIYLYGGVDIIMAGNLAANTGLIQVIDYAECVIEIFPNAFQDCSALTTAIMNSVITIGISAFQSCSLLATGQFESATSVGDFAFASVPLNVDSSFQSLVTIGEGGFTASAISSDDINTSQVTTIGNNAFDTCTELVDAIFPVCTSAGTGVFSNSSIENIEFEILTAIPSGFCSACASLQTASFPVATTAGDQAFSDAGFSVITPDFFPLLETIDYRTFYSLPNATSIEFSSLTDIGIECFSVLNSCTIITLPVLTIVGTDCLSVCPLLEEVYLPDLLSWGDSLLEQCPSLTTVDIESCVDMVSNITGSSGENMVFANMPNVLTEASGGFFTSTVGNVVTVNVNASLQTINAGNPAAWITQLLADNPGSTVNYIP